MALRRVPSFSSRPGFPIGLRVLVLDGTPNCAATNAQLKQCSYEVTSCSSITEALAAISSAKLAAAPFDVLLGEASALTGKSGDCDRLREQLKDLPTIVMSECPKPEEVMLSIKLGVAEVLERPLCPLKLKNIWQHTVRRMLRAPSSPGSRRDSAQLERAGSCYRTSHELCTSQNGSTNATQAHMPVLAEGLPDLTCASSGMQNVLAKSQLYSVKASGANLADSHPGTTVSEPSTPGAGSPTDSRRGSKEIEDGSRRGHKRKSKDLARANTAPVLHTQPREPARRGVQSAEALAEQCNNEGNSTSSSQNGICAILDLPAVSAPVPLSCLDTVAAVPISCAFPPTTPPLVCTQQPWPVPASPPGCLPLGMAWGVPLNPMAVAPGITPPIFPPHAPPQMMLPAPQAWPMFPQPTLTSDMAMQHALTAGAGMFSPLMPGLGIPHGNPFMPHTLQNQLPPLPMSMLMGACGPAGMGMNTFNGVGMCGMGEGLMGLQSQHPVNMASPCSPTPTDPSLASLSEKSSQDALALGFDDMTFIGLQQDGHVPKMPRCESNALLPSLEDLINDNSNDADMELELEALSLGCLGTGTHFKRNDSLDDLISQSVVAF